MKDTKRMWVWVGVAVVVIGATIFIVWKPTIKAPMVGVNPPAPVYAPAGKIVLQFPTNLILKAATSTVSSSYYIGYSSSTKQSTVVFNSTSSMESVYMAYLKYFLDNDWKIANTITKYQDSRGIQAGRSSSTVAVAIVTQGKGSQVTISFLVQ